MGDIPGYPDELGHFLVFIPCLTQKIGEFWPITLNLSAFLGIKSNGHYIFQLLEELKVMGRYIF